MIRVTQLSTTDAAGGAALAAHRLHDGLNARGDAASTMFVALANHPGADVREFNPAWPAPRGLGRTLFRAGRRWQRNVRSVDGPLFSQEWTAFGRYPMTQLPPADVYHLHWTADLVDFRMLPALARRAPMVWTLHDMNPFTGGCHYDLHCGRFTTRCGECPILTAPAPDDASAAVLRRKAKILDAMPADRLTVVAPSRWMAAGSRRSRAFGRFDVRVIPNGIDLETFCPVDREAARARVGLEAGDRVVLFVAELLGDTRKGWRELQAALARVADLPRLRVLTLGNGDLAQMRGPAFRHLGQLSDAAAIRDAYNAADVFVMPSLQDNFPNTVLESLACGTPVAGFETGGVVDAVEDGVCGLLAPTGDTDGLAAQIRCLLEDDARRGAMAAAARDRACALYGVERQARLHHELYAELLQTRRQGSQASAASLTAVV